MPTRPDPLRHPDPLLIDESIPALVSRLVDDTRTLVSAEITLHKVRLFDRIAAYKTAAIFFAAAGVLMLAALFALLVGLILTLSTLIGPGFATAVVIVAIMQVAIVLAMLGKARLKPPIMPDNVT